MHRCMIKKNWQPTYHFITILNPIRMNTLKTIVCKIWFFKIEFSEVIVKTVCLLVPMFKKRYLCDYLEN